MAYNPAFPANGGGYVVIKDPNTGEPHPDGTYRSGSLIYFGGLYVQITDGPSGLPVAGDIFQVVSTPSQALGEDAGIKNFYGTSGVKPTALALGYKPAIGVNYVKKDLTFR